MSSDEGTFFPNGKINKYNVWVAINKNNVRNAT